MEKSETEWRQLLLRKLFEAQKVKLNNLGMRMSSLADLADLGRTLFHYTTAQGLHGIVKDNCLWATAAAYLNDASEIEYGCNVLEEVLGKWRKNNGDRSTVSANVVELLQTYFSEPDLKLRRAMAVYIACFCANDNLLSQWRAYGQAGGYSIGFSLFPKGLEGIGTKKLTGLKAENEPYRATLVKVLYEKQDQFSILEDILNRSLLSLEKPEIKSIASNLGSETGTLITVAALVIEQFLMNQIVALRTRRSSMSTNGG